MAIYNSIDLAKYIITYCNQNKTPITNMNLQKLLITIRNKAQRYIFLDPIDIETIKYPIIKKVYWRFAHYGPLPINNNYQIDINLTDEDLELITQCINQYLEALSKNFFYAFEPPAYD